PLLLVLALGVGTHHPYGIGGAGVSSLLSECVAAIYAIVYTMRRPIYRIFARWEFDLRLAWRSTALGFPEVVFLSTQTGPDIFLVAMLAPLGPIAVAAFRALNVVSDLTFIVPSPLQSATQTVIGQRLGAGDIEGAQLFFDRARRLSLWIATGTAAFCAIFAWPLAYVITLNAVVASAAALPL